MIAAILLLVRVSSALPNYYMNQPLPADCSLAGQPNYMGHLPSLSLPYLGNVPIPNNLPQIKPTPPTTTRVVTVVTKYISKHPICLKVTSRKPPCKLKSDVTVTKELTFRNRNNKMMRGFSGEDELVSKPLEDLDLEGSEASRKFPDPTLVTPSLRGSAKITELLIEDRLDRLEVLLPHYKRLRNYETTTITVTKTTSNHRAQATLLVKNCIPEGIEFCDNRRKQGGQDLANNNTNNKNKNKTKRKKI